MERMGGRARGCAQNGGNVKETMMITLRTAAGLRCNENAMARALAEVPIGSAELRSVLARDDAQISSWFAANITRAVITECSVMRDLKYRFRPVALQGRLVVLVGHDRLL